MDIAIYISDLLRKHDELSVSGLGTFFKKSRAGYYDKQQQIFIPPGQQVKYRSDYAADSRLAEYISAEKHISIGSSEHFIEKFSEHIHTQLKTAQTFDVPPLGVFHNTNNIYSFIPSESLSVDHTFFGLNPVKDTVTASDEVIINDPVITHAPLEVTEPDEASFEVIEPAGEVTVEEIAVEEELEADNTGSKRKFPLVAFIIPALLIAITTLYFLSPATFKYLTEKPGKSQVRKTVIPIGKPETFTDSIATADSIVQSLGAQGFEVDEPRDTLKATIQSNPVIPSGITYEIIGASLNSLTDADRMVRNFKSMGIDSRIIRAKEKKRNNILISLGSFNTKKSARRELIRIKKDIEPGAYIFDYNNK
ncbi:MAG TPA: SPOR domain-containing protein [Sphingobacteriaceae bacterium]|nr:SPOR domain-containing protein [Sphingobacteriaceae bacterium]